MTCNNNNVGGAQGGLYNEILDHSDLEKERERERESYHPVKE